MNKKQLAELVRKLDSMRNVSQISVATALHRGDREAAEYHRGRLDACRDALQLIEVVQK